MFLIHVFTYELAKLPEIREKQDCQTLCCLTSLHVSRFQSPGRSECKWRAVCGLIAMATAAIKVIKDPKSRINSHGNSVRCVCYSPDGEQFATASSDKVVKCFSNEGRELFK